MLRKHYNDAHKRTIENEKLHPNADSLFEFEFSHFNLKLGIFMAFNPRIQKLKYWVESSNKFVKRENKSVFRCTFFLLIICLLMSIIIMFTEH